MPTFFTYTDPIVPMHHPRALVDVAIAQGAERGKLLKGVGILPGALVNPDARLSYGQWGVLVGNALRQTRNPALGFDVGSHIGIPQMGVLGLALMSSETLGDALRAALQYSRIIAPLWELSLVLEPGCARLQIRPSLPLDSHARFAVENLVSAIDRLGGLLLGSRLPIQGLRFAYPRPVYVSRYERFGVPLSFDQETTEIDFDPSVLDASIATADSVTRQLAERLCAEHSVALPAGLAAGGVVGRVRAALSTARGGPPKLEALAQTLRTSPRTLQRALHETGTSYQALCDEWRRDQAENWVRSTRLTLDDMAGQLGFSSVRGFRRAFQRWTGHSPTAFRRNSA